MASSQDSTLTPLGTLSILPRELRDEIYRHVQNHKYLLSPYPRAKCLIWQSCDNTIKNLSMRVVSKTIREEFLAILHAEATFCIWEEPSMRSWFPRAWTRNDIPFSQQIQNVEFATVVSKRSESKQSEAFYAAHGMDRFGKNTSILKADAVAISFFTGTEVLRKTCNIRFIRSWAPKMILIVQSPFFDVIKDLVGFATVVLHVLPHKVDWRAEEALFYIGHDASYTNYAVGFRVIVDAMSRALEPTLGPSVISLKNGDDCAEDKWKITFHPQDFNSRKKDSDADSESSVNEAVPPLNNS